tara:strand:- start:3395 stop:4345 length:951 start_codon:yes stop_codon:yes gene_type:complete
MKINKKYQGGGINKKRMGNQSMVFPSPQPLTPLMGNKGDTPLRTYQEGGKETGNVPSKKTFTGYIYPSQEAANAAIKNRSYKKHATKNEILNNEYQLNFKGEDGKISTKTFRPFDARDGAKMQVKYMQDGGKPEFDEDKYQLYKKVANPIRMKEKVGQTEGKNEKFKDEEFDPGVDRESTEEAGTPTKNLTTERPDGDKWLGDTPPPTYGASEEHVPFLMTVYEMMDAGEDMDQMYHSQQYLRPYIKYIMAGQNETVLPSLENAEGSKNNEEEGKGKLPSFMQNMSKDEIMNVLKESFGGVRQMGNELRKENMKGD